MYSCSYVSSVKTKHLYILTKKCGIITVSVELLECTCRKTENLLNTAGSICKGPNMANAMCVASDAKGRPHIVLRNEKGDLVCDNEYPCVCHCWSRSVWMNFSLCINECTFLETILQCIDMISLKMLVKSKVSK